MHFNFATPKRCYGHRDDWGRQVGTSVSKMSSVIEMMRVLKSAQLCVVQMIGVAKLLQLSLEG